MNNIPGRIAIFMALGTLETVSSLRDSIKLMAEHGYMVDVYLPGNPVYPKPQFESLMISVFADHSAIFSQGSIALPKWTCGRGLKLYSWIVHKFYGHTWRNVIFKRRLKERHAQTKYTCLIGIDQEAISDTAEYAKYLKVPFVYWSLELRFADQCTTEQQRHLKEKDIYYSRLAAFSIVQDQWRKKALVTENRLDEHNVMIVPNAPMGKALHNKKNFMREKWSIPPEKKIILCAGSLAPWMMSRELVEAANQWPDEYLLVMHSRRRLDKWASKYEKEIVRLADHKKVVFSFDPLAADEYHQMLCSADVGIAFYSAESQHSPSGIDMNMKIMGLSSGKISDYLQHGLPIVVNEMIGPKDLVSDYQCGVCVEDAKDIAHALSSICESYIYFSDNACKCFNERLNLSLYFNKVIDEIDGLRI